MRESLASIAHLSESPPNSPTTHLNQLLHQRIVELLVMQHSLRKFTDRRAESAHLLANYRDQVEAAQDKRTSTLRGISTRSAQTAFLAAYESALFDFEKEFESATASFETWDLRTPIASTSQIPHTSTSAWESWTDELGIENATSIRGFLSLLLKDPYSLGAGLSTLEGQSLTSIHPPSSPNRLTTNSPTALSILSQLVASAQGAEGILSLALGAWEMGVNELVGREASRNRGSSKGKGKVGIGAREKELAALLVEILSSVYSLGLNHHSSYAKTSDSTGSGPLSVHQGHEAILLHLFHNVHSLPPTPPTPLPLPPPQIVSPSTMSRQSSSSSATLKQWGGTAVSTLSTISSYSASGIHTAVSTAANVFLPPSPSFTNPPSPQIPSATAAPPLTASPTIPSAPSKILPPTPMEWTQVDSFLHQAATALLRLFTPSSQSLSPLAEVLVGRLLSHSFSEGVGGGTGYRKVLNLAVVRWYAFGWLRDCLGGAETLGSTAGVPFGVALSSEGVEIRSATGDLLDGVYVSGKDVELLLRLHKIMYGALVDACSNEEKESTSRGEEIDREVERLRNAAKEMVSTWGQQNESTRPPTSSEIPIRAMQITPSEFLSLYSNFSPLLLRTTTNPIFSPPVSTFKRNSERSRTSSSVGTDSSGGSMSDNLDRLVVELGGWHSRRLAEGATVYWDQSAIRSRIPAGLATEEVVDDSDGNDLFSPVTTTPPPLSKLDIPGQLFRPIKTSSTFPSSVEMSLLHQGIMTLVHSHYYFYDRSPSKQEIDSVLAMFDTASSRALVEGNVNLHLIFDQTRSILSRYRSSLDAIFLEIARPLREAQVELEVALQLVRGRLASVESQRRRLLERAKEERERFDELRLKGWHLSLKADEIGARLRSRLRALLLDDRTEEERDELRVEYTRWMKERGIYDFVRAGEEDSAFGYALMLIQQMVERSVESASTSPFFRREEIHLRPPTAEVEPKEEEESTATTWSGSIYGAGSTILNAPINLAFPVATSHIPSPSPTDHVLLSFGSASPSFVASRTTVADYRLRLTSKLMGYFVSDLSASRLIRIRNEEGRLIGCDGWMAEYALPGSSSAIPPRQHFQILLERFINHPSPQQKLQALFQLEVSIATSHSTPPPHTRQPTDEAPLSPRKSLGANLTKLSDLISRRRTIMGSPSIYSHDGGRSGSGEEGRMDYTEAATTDDLLNSLEEVILHFRPEGLFTNLQLVGALSDPTTLNSNCLGKAFVRCSAVSLWFRLLISRIDSGISH